LKKIGILGSTGSIGTQCLDVARLHPELFEVVSLACGRDIDRLESQIREFRPALAVVYDEERAAELKGRIADTSTKVLAGMPGLIDMASSERIDVLVTAIVGMIGIQPTVAALEAGHDIALANKETCVTAGHIIIPLAKERNCRILPVDSEHSAIFQALQGRADSPIRRILLTASGGPFYDWHEDALKTVTVKEALAHPTWTMGPKITVDSATMVNKGLEVMEARWLFDVPVDQIDVVVQPKSIIHSMVEFTDGAVIAQLGTPDMKLPIQYALYYPERRYLPGERLDFRMLKEIVFDVPDNETFLGLPMAIEASRAGGTMPTVFNAANEAAVRKFLDRKAGFLDIYRMIRYAMDHHKVIPEPTLDQILETEKEVYALLEKDC